MLKITAPDGTVTELDEEGFARLPWHEVTTHTRWTDGPQQFRGPLLRDVLELAGAGEGVLQGRELRMTAMNEFQVDIPASDAWDFRPILAREMNGRTMRIRDKGPIWLIYPRDDIAALQNPVIDERWIWQLVDITVI
ncbi:molybdopterin-dependent oxidoreductase [Tabrizicola sp. DMG-N-6]|uniref:Molybdopterin-dependent oxidoreductase n=2 Tax=Szabonella alba TaxID=2804194 RepID=A0A8K0VBX4_9RHOB|nr:molybdopterin-dependent oxidoreductase [Szabonella alba]